MFKNGTNPLNLNFKLPTPLGGPTPNALNSNKKPNQSSSNLNSANSSLSSKSNTSTVSLAANLNSKKDSSSTSFNSSATNIARSLTLRSPSKPVVQDNNKSIKSDTINRSVISTKSDRPTVKPPPLPSKPPAINRRQSFDSGQLNARQLNSSSSSNNSSNLNNTQSTSTNHKFNKPPPPPRYATMKPQISPIISQSQQTYQNQTPTTTGRPHKSTQNLSSTSTSGNSTPLNSTLKMKTNTKNYPSTRPMNAPPPPPKLPNNINYPSNNNYSNMQSSSSSYNNNSSQLTPNVPKPPPLPNLPLNSAPLPPSLTSAMSNLSSNRQTNNNAFYDKINSQTIAPAPPPPVPQIDHSSKGRVYVLQNMFIIIYCLNLKNSQLFTNFILFSTFNLDLETRYKSQFVDISLLPTPDPFTGCKKTYSIAMGKSKIRSRAPLPPNETTIGARSGLLNV